MSDASTPGQTPNALAKDGTPYHDPNAPEVAPCVRAWDLLTSREQQIATHLANAFTNREIANALSISIKTVDTHRGHIIKKLACKNNVGLVRYMLREGVVSL